MKKKMKVALILLLIFWFFSAIIKNKIRINLEMYRSEKQL